MSNFKITIDGKSFLLGLLVCVCFLFFSGFDSTSHDIQTGRYHVVTDAGRDIILDTESGEFVISSHLRPNLFKYKFESIVETKPRERRK